MKYSFQVTEFILISKEFCSCSTLLLFCLEELRYALFVWITGLSAAQGLGVWTITGMLSTASTHSNDGLDGVSISVLLGHGTQHLVHDLASL